MIGRADHLYLYGSRARKEAKDTSDWDFIVFTRRKFSSQESFDKIVFPLVLLGQENNQEVSVLVYSYKEWRERRDSLFYWNVMKDRVRIV